MSKKTIRTAAGLAAGAAAAVICPPAAALLGVASLLKGSRKYAQSGDVDDARDMVLGYSDVLKS